MMHLTFVYNADSGLFNLLADVAHKIFSPATYQCHLCAVTYGPFGMHREWQEFVKNLGVPVEFLHRDEFSEKYGQRNTLLPAIFEITPDGESRLWMSAQEINAAQSLVDLQEAIELRMAVSLGENPVGRSKGSGTVFKEVSRFPADLGGVGSPEIERFPERDRRPER